MSASATGYFGALTKAGVMAWQTAKGVTPAAGYFGAKSRAAFGGVSTTPTTRNSGGSDHGQRPQRSRSRRILRTARCLFRHRLSGRSRSSPSRTRLLLKSRLQTRFQPYWFVSYDSTLSAVYLFSGARRLTDAAGISSRRSVSFNDATGLFTVPAGRTYTVSVRSNILTGTNGQQVGVSSYFRSLVKRHT